MSEKTIQCTAWDLLGDHSDLLDETHIVRLLPKGRVYYAGAFLSRAQTVHLQRIVTTPTRGLNLISRYVKPDQPVELVPIDSPEIQALKE